MNRPAFTALWLSVFLALTVAGCAHAPDGQWVDETYGHAPGSPTFRVLSLNIAHGVRQPVLGFMASRQDVENNLSAIGRALARENADIVGLQEVHVHGLPEADLVDHLRLVAEGSGYANRFHGNHYVPDRQDLQKGTALLSHAALEDAHSEAFAAAAGDDHGWVVATVRPEAFDGEAIDVVSIHLDPYSPGRRVAQMEALTEAFRVRTRPLVVLGDFNTGWGGRDGVRHLAEALDLTAFRPRDGARTYPTALPIQRLDWILVSSELRIVRHRTFREAATDHRGVVAEVGFSPQAWAKRQGGRARLQLAARLQEVRGALLAEASQTAPASPPSGGAGRPLAPIIEGPPPAPPGRLLVAEAPAPSPPREVHAPAPDGTGADLPTSDLASTVAVSTPTGLSTPAAAPVPMSVAGSPLAADPFAALLDWLGEAGGPAGVSFWQRLHGAGDRRPIDLAW